MQKHFILSAVGLILGLAALAWLQPETPAGATVVVAGAILLINFLGVLSNSIGKLVRKKSTDQKARQN